MEASVQAGGRFERLRNEELRVASVAYQLSTASAALCGPSSSPQSGLVLHSIEQYGLGDRDEAARVFNLDQSVAVMAVVGGSPAERAGLQAGDELLAVNNRALNSEASSAVPTRAAVDRAQSILVEEMRRGPVVLRISGLGGDRKVTFLAQAGCLSNVELIPGPELNAWADGTRVMVSEGLVRHSATDDDLALVIGHEMAHNLLHHRRRLAAEGVLANRLLPLTEAGTAAMRETEEEADRLAVSLAANASYDLSGASSFLAGLMDGTGAVAATHPDPTRRLTLLRSAIADVRSGHNPPERISE